ncbi:uncharacterized protein LOC100824070 isoform X2 [Brachypodium distachyon]|uniref:uncharacterized protein LOC100824070 isoform X2 n=1 Tax=Brachypodium distachyon TaxID=15368 RepID=UPI000D0E2401|nr:uncharacterized protein LOC100824070 isoform X2 [Brachypodium distachyon]|eukprot:XP_024314017.1 uncharacterized protein LOC100824070 isoform X2 [Brachypodium distachyon]
MWPVQRHFAGGVRGFCFSSRLPMYEKSHVIVAAGFLSLTLGGGIWYLKEDARERVARKKMFVMTEEEAQKEDAMKKRFEEWMIEFKPTYKDKKEAERRYEIFKQNSQRHDEFLASIGKDFPARLNCFGDRHKDEFARDGYQTHPCNSLRRHLPGVFYKCHD